MKIKKLEKENYPEWLKKAIIENESIWIDENENIIWKGGIWENGIWKDGIWKGGTWKGGIWKGGTWEYGTWENGIWENGIWKGGTWEYGTWKDGYKLYVTLSKFTLYFSSEKIMVGCKEFTVEEMIKNRDVNVFPFSDSFSEFQKEAMKRDITNILKILGR